ncbi:MAG: DUF418 domain-containing protein [Spirosomataceae bacterium]
MKPLTSVSLQTRSVFHVLLGCSVLGILLLNIQDFGMTKSTVNQFIVNPHGGTYWLLTIINLFFGTKMGALLTILFGASIALFFAKVQPINGFTVVDLYVRRQFWLMAFGLVNAILLLFQYDLLFPFSIVGILLFPLHRLSARGFMIGAVLMALILGGKSYWDFAETKQKYEKYLNVLAYEKKYKIPKPTAKQLADSVALKKIKTLNDEQKKDTTAWKGIVTSTKFDKKANEAQVDAMRSDYAKVWNYVLPKTQEREARWLYRLGLWELASLMLLGMALFKWGFFSHSFSNKRHALLATLGLLLGLSLSWLSMGSAELNSTDITKYISGSIVPLHEILSPFERALMAVGWASLVILLYRWTMLKWLWIGIEAVGQMALTNYLIQTILCTLFFNGYGMSYYGELTFFQLYFIVAEIWLIQTVGSVVWLRYFQFGPAEWLWHSLVVWQRQPMLQTETLDSTPSEASSINP